LPARRLASDMRHRSLAPRATTIHARSGREAVVTTVIVGATVKL
jgi:hypothetical protein